MRVFAVPAIRDNAGTTFFAGTTGKTGSDMGNHLRELMECIDQMDVTASSSLTDQYVDAALSWFRLRASEAMCFEAGDPNDQAGMKIISELVRLPYPTCWIELHRRLDEGTIIVGGLLIERDGGLEGQVWTKSDGRWGYTMFFRSVAGENQSKISGINQADAEVAATIIGSFRLFCRRSTAPTSVASNMRRMPSCKRRVPSEENSRCSPTGRLS